MVVDKGSKEYASLSRFALAQMYSKQGKAAQAEQHLRYLADNPTALFSKENAQIELAKLSEADKRRLARQFRQETAGLADEDRKQLLELLEQHLLPVPADLNELLLAQLQER